jgi:hypothetical protein
MGQYLPDCWPPEHKHNANTSTSFALPFHFPFLPLSGIPPVCLDPVAQLLSLLSPFLFLCARIGASALSLSILRELPAVGLEGVFIAGAAFSSLSRLFSIVPYSVWPAILCLRALALLSMTAESVAEFCEFREIVAEFETHGVELSLSENTADRLVAF